LTNFLKRNKKFDNKNNLQNRVAIVLPMLRLVFWFYSFSTHTGHTDTIRPEQHPAM